MNTEQALDDYALSLSYNPENAAPYYNRGNVYLEQSEYDLAIDDYSQVIEIDPENTDAYYARGLTFYHIGDYEMAIEDYSKAIEIDPANALAYVGRGNTYSILSQNNRALVDYRIAISLGVSDETEESLVFLNRGTIYIRLQEYESAETDLTRALELNPDNADIYARLGHLYDVQDRFPEALEQYQQYLEMTGDDADPVIVERISELEDILAPEAALLVI